jgi:hypothetical protein
MFHLTGLAQDGTGSTASWPSPSWFRCAAEQMLSRSRAPTAVLAAPQADQCPREKSTEQHPYLEGRAATAALLDTDFMAVCMLLVV